MIAAVENRTMAFGDSSERKTGRGAPEETAVKSKVTKAKAGKSTAANFRIVRRKGKVSTIATGDLVSKEDGTSSDTSM